MSARNVRPAGATRGGAEPPVDPKTLDFVEALAAMYADLWHAGKLDDMLGDAHAQSEAE